MVNEKNLKPDERIDEIMELSNEYGACFIISYFLNELAINSDFKRLDDECYWKDVLAEFNSRTTYDN